MQTSTQQVSAELIPICYSRMEYWHSQKWLDSLQKTFIMARLFPLITADSCPWIFRTGGLVGTEKLRDIELLWWCKSACHIILSNITDNLMLKFLFQPLDIRSTQHGKCQVSPFIPGVTVHKNSVLEFNLRS